MRKYVLVFLFGYLAHIGVTEVVEYRVASRIRDCLSIMGNPYMCVQEMELSKLEALLLYTPNFWIPVIKDIKRPLIEEK